MVKKMFNLLMIPFKYIFIFIKSIVTYIAKGIVFILKNLYKLIKFILSNFSVFVIYFLLYEFKGIYFVLKQLFRLIVDILTLIFSFFKYIFIGIKVFFTYLYKGIYFVLYNLFKILKAFFIYEYKGIYFLFYNIIFSFFKYVYIGIKKIFIFIFSIIKKIIMYFITGLNGIITGIKKLFILIKNKLLKPITKEILKALKFIDNIMSKIISEYKEKVKIQQEKRRKKEEEKRIAREKLLAEKNAKKEAIRKEKEKLLAEKNAKKEAIRKEKEKLMLEKLAEKEEKKKEKERLILEKIARNEKKNKENQELLEKKKEKEKLIREAKKNQKKNKEKKKTSLKERYNNWYNNLSFIRDNKNRNEMKRQILLINFEGEDAVRSEEKIMYRYVAKNLESGKLEKGQFAAFSKLDVHSYLLSEGYEVYEIIPIKHYKGGLSSGLGHRKIKRSDLVFFLTQLSTFLKSGLPLLESVKILEKQTKKKTYKDLYRAIIYELTMGENFSEALSKQGDSFPKLLTNMIKSSELTGNLPETLDDMAIYFEETEKTRKQMVSAMMYPGVIFVFATIIVVFIMLFVIPEFVGIYSDMNAELPGITTLVINASNFLKGNILYLILGIVGLIMLLRALYKSIKVFRTLVQWTLMHLPVFGKIIIYNEVTMFTKTFGSLLNHNVFITDSMEVLSKITNNEIYKMLIFDTITNLARGEAISDSFKNHWAFPVVAYEMLLTGEKTGQLGDMMNKVSNYYQLQHKNSVNQIKTFIEPVMIVFLTVIVGAILLSVILPMFSMYSVGL